MKINLSQFSSICHLQMHLGRVFTFTLIALPVDIIKRCCIDSSFGGRSTPVSRTDIV